MGLDVSLPVSSDIFDINFDGFSVCRWSKTGAQTASRASIFDINFDGFSVCRWSETGAQTASRAVYHSRRIGGVLKSDENHRFSNPVLNTSLNTNDPKPVRKPYPGHGLPTLPYLPYPRLGARGSGLGAGAGLILDYRKIV